MSRIGVLALQGGFREHLAVLRRLGGETVEIRLPEQLETVNALVIPGGESTAIGRLMATSGLTDAVRGFAGPIFGTCAGMILLARESVDGVPSQPHLGRIDLVVRRNGYGPQRCSFEADVDLADERRPFRGVFIRAPRITASSPGVEVLGELDGEPVLLRQGAVLVAAFHPELTDDTRIHQRFLQTIRDQPRTPHDRGGNHTIPPTSPGLGGPRRRSATHDSREDHVAPHASPRPRTHPGPTQPG